MSTKLNQLAELGQSIWLDFIRRSSLKSGELAALVAQGVRGVTSNPSIFEKAIAGSTDYDEALKPLVKSDKTIEEIYEILAIEDIQRATDILRPVYDKTNGMDGFVSLEVSPKIAHDTEKTITEASRLFREVDRPNLMIKIPATKAGVPAIEATIAKGINVNVTLIFSRSHYEPIAQAYIDGLERLAASGGDVSKVASVASFFVSRIDTAVDKQLEALNEKAYQGKTAIAIAKSVYTSYQEIFSGARWDDLAAQGARVQRPLWASTSTKNPNYPDTLYVDNLIGADTVNTVPPATLDAFLDHGKVALTLEKDMDAVQKLLQAVTSLGIDLDAVTQKLQDDGVAAFEKSFVSLLQSIADKRERLG